MAKSKKTSAAYAGNKMMSLDKAKAGRIVFFRILIIILTDILVSSLFDFVKSEALRHLTFHQRVQTPLSVVFGILFAASVLYLVFTFVKKVDTSAHYMTPAMIAAVTLYFFITTLLFDQFATTPFLFYTMTVIVSVLFAVYYVYTVLFYKK